MAGTDLLSIAPRSCGAQPRLYTLGLMQEGAAEAPFPHRHLLGIERLSPDDINQFLDLADGYVELNRQADKKRSLLRGRTIINCFFENSTRTRTSRGRRQAARRRRHQHVRVGELDGQGRDPD